MTFFRVQNKTNSAREISGLRRNKFHKEACGFQKNLKATWLGSKAIAFRGYPGWVIGANNVRKHIIGNLKSNLLPENCNLFGSNIWNRYKIT